MYPREMETGSKERDGGGEGKSLAYKHGSFLERGISFRANSRTGYQQSWGKLFLERGANLESWAAHSHPKKHPSAQGLVYQILFDNDHDNVLFGVLYNPMYIDFIQII